MKAIYTLLCSLIIVSSIAQTKRIAHRFHSGSDKESSKSMLGSYGAVAPRKVKVHLESGRDTMVYAWDTLAHPYYLRKENQPKENEVGKKPIQQPKEVGHVAGKLVM